MFSDKLNIYLALACAILGLLLTACPSDNKDPVLSKAKLGVQPTELDFGENDTQKAFTVKNTGQQNLSWTISEEVDWVVDFQSTSGKINGGGQSQITVKIDRSKLKNAVNTAKINIIATADDGGQLEGGGIDVTIKATKALTPQVSMSANDVTEKTSSGAKAKASIELLGSSTISQHGHVWSTARKPSIDDGEDSRERLWQRTSVGEFQSTLTGLQPNTTYYIRAYATNTQGTSYSNEVSFKTLVPGANNPPTDISLNNKVIAENAAQNTVIGTLTTTDPDASDTYNYTLVSGGSDFNISGNSLRASKTFDYETKSSYTLRIRTSDGKGGTFEKTFTITITDVGEVLNRPPTAISLSGTSIAENNSVNAVVGTLTTTDPDASDIHKYTLVSGGSDFNISGNSLRASKTFDYETKSSYTLRIRTSDGKGGTFEKTFTITITDVGEVLNRPPTAISLSGTSIAENNSVNAVVGTLTTTDPDASDIHKYTLVSGGSDFNTSGNSLRASKSFDYETKSSYALRIRTSDGKGGTFEKTFTIKILNVNEAPTNITLSKDSIAENNSVNVVIGTLSTTDPDASDSHTYTLVSGGSDFNISGNSLRASKSFDYETKSSYTLRIRTGDGKGGTFEKDFTITITRIEPTFGGSDRDHAYSVIQTSDGGYALAGYTKSKGAGGRDMWLVKVNSDGTTQWDKTFGGVMMMRLALLSRPVMGAMRWQARHKAKAQAALTCGW